MFRKAKIELVLENGEVSVDVDGSKDQLMRLFFELYYDCKKKGKDKISSGAEKIIMTTANLVDELIANQEVEATVESDKKARIYFDQNQNVVEGNKSELRALWIAGFKECNNLRYAVMNFYDLVMQENNPEIKEKISYILIKNPFKFVFKIYTPSVHRIVWYIINAPGIFILHFINILYILYLLLRSENPKAEIFEIMSKYSEHTNYVWEKSTMNVFLLHSTVIFWLSIWLIYLL